jgi:hypothetical protein
MLKFIAPIKTSKIMKHTLIIVTLFILYFTSFAQSEQHIKLAEKFKNGIKLPAIVSELKPHIEIDKALLNSLLFDNQTNKAKFYAYNGNLFNVTTYGRIPLEPMKWRTWADESHTKRIERSFDTKTYALGQVPIDENFHVWITKIVGFQKTFIDLYVFNKTGELKSLINLYEVEYESSGEPSEIASVYISSTIAEDGTIFWEENRFSVKTVREYKLQPDGYFKVVKQESEGEYEP